MTDIRTKNIVHSMDIEKMEDLPKRIGIYKALKASNHQRKSLGRTDFHNFRGKSPWSIVTRILTSYLGKSANDAFSHFCRLVPKYQQKMFWDRFVTRRYWFNNRFYLDEYGNIQNDGINPYKGPYYLYSPDYKTNWFLRKDTPNKIARFLSKVVEERRDLPWRFFEFYEERAVSGIRYVFESKNDPRYQKHYQEQEKSRRKQRRIERAASESKEYCFFTKEELVERKEARMLSRLMFDIALYIKHYEHRKRAVMLNVEHS